LHQPCCCSFLPYYSLQSVPWFVCPMLWGACGSGWTPILFCSLLFDWLYWTYWNH
jgi:hypothetical protein